MKLLLDTSFLVDLQAGKKGALKVMERHENKEVFVSVVSAEEVLEGSPSQDKASHFLSRFQTLEVTDSVAIRCASTQRRLGKKGRKLAENDSWIAATAVHHRLCLVSDDSAFRRVPGLRVIGFPRKPSR
jgi:predicted nucleic acid-binding protein